MKISLAHFHAEKQVYFLLAKSAVVTINYVQQDKYLISSTISLLIEQNCTSYLVGTFVSLIRCGENTG